MTEAGPQGYICIHGHFYQPPRENPWLESIELQDSAAPYHDWNERITAECYAPNARSRILDDEGRIAAIVNNYARISFNFGPTLLAWMEHRAPDVYGAIIRADRESRERFSGHGNALAQAYNHMILPLASERDQRTQIHWGMRDFHHRFGRDPEGMWLPETAANTATLDLLAEAGIAFAVLAPHQARRVRRIGTRKWDDIGEGGIDTSVPYRIRLPSGRQMAVFFYQGETSQAVAFEGLLTSGERFAQRLLSSFDENGEGLRLAHIATDGETYGHHHRHGDMALAYALEQIDERADVELTNYGEFLERRPPEHDVEIADDTSWSCAHGIERWRSDCGCNTGRGWHQRWRSPLRDALDWLRDRLEPLYEDRGGKIFSEPWSARDDYIDIVLDRSPSRINGFLERHSRRDLDDSERITALKLLELQRHAMLMYTSCGWFFDELSGIETVQVLQYAGRAIQLAEEIGNERLEERFLERLGHAESNLPELGDGRRVYDRHVVPAMVDLAKVAAHYAAMSLFEERPEERESEVPLFGGYAEEAPRVYCYELEPEDHRVIEAGRTRLALGRLRVTSEVTWESATVSFGALHFGDHNLNAASRAFLGLDAYRSMVDEVTEAFERADLPEVVRRFDRHFGASPYSLRTLFRDEQRKVLGVILDGWFEEADASYRQLYERQSPLIHFLTDLHVPLPRPFRANAELVVNARLLEQFESDDCDPDEVREVLDATEAWGLELDVAALAFSLSTTVARVAVRLRRRAQSAKLLERLDELIELAQSLPWTVELAETQTVFYDVLHEVHPRLVERGDAEALAKAELMRGIGERLDIRIPVTTLEDPPAVEG